MGDDEMTTGRDNEDVEAYWNETGLNELVEQSITNGAIRPDIEDLVRLHRLVTERRILTILEFGVGYSTLVMAHALAVNREEIGDVVAERPLRNSNLFHLFSVDANPHWIDLSIARIPDELRPMVTITASEVHAATFGGRLCHLYSHIPNVIAGFIYIDGPDPKDVSGQVHGLDFSIPERTVMAADLLLMEPTLLPGTVVLIDGRTNNARFIERNLQRDWRVTHDVEGDVTEFVLVEPTLGEVEVLGVDISSLVDP